MVLRMCGTAGSRCEEILSSRQVEASDAVLKHAEARLTEGPEPLRNAMLVYKKALVPLSFPQLLEHPLACTGTCNEKPGLDRDLLAL